MTQQFTTRDLEFINKLEIAFKEMGGYIIKKSADTFSWTDKQYEFIETGEQEYRKDMIEAFILDLMENTKSYQYKIYHNDNYILKEVINELTYIYDSTSSYLKLRLLDLLDESEKIFIDMLEFAQEQEDDLLLFQILKKKNNYGQIQAPSDNNTLSNVVYYYQQLQKNKKIEAEKVQQSFIHHMKNSNIAISDANLIKIYLSIFPEKDLPLFLKEFNIEREDVCIDVKENAYSMISLSLQTLASVNLSHHDISNIIDATKNLNFPQLFLMARDDSKIDILVSTQGINNEKKAVMLFEQIVEQKNNLKLNIKDGLKTLSEIIDNINEVVHLESVVDKGHEKRQKIKI